MSPHPALPGKPQLRQQHMVQPGRCLVMEKIGKYGEKTTEKPWEIYGKTRFELSKIYEDVSFAGKYLEIFLADFPG